MTDIERLLDWLARGTSAETQRWPGHVRPDSVTAMLRLVNHVFGRGGNNLHVKNERSRLFRALQRVSDLRDKMGEEHEAWLRGGVHPQGTRERNRADAKRHAERARRNHGINRVLLVIVCRCARHYGWAEPTTLSEELFRWTIPTVLT